MTVARVWRIIICMGLQGKIIINPYLRPKQSVFQAQRICDELVKLGVSVEIVTDAFLRLRLENGKIASNLLGADFIVYLDKDKYLSEMFAKSGVRLFNSHQSIRVCDDKARTYIALSDKKVKIPKTAFAPLCYNGADTLKKEVLQNLVNGLGGYPIIVKECYGSMGKGVHKAENFDELFELYTALKTSPHFYQEFISSSSGTDIRITLVGGRAISVMKRSNQNDFRSNVAVGGNGVKIDLDDQEYSEFVKTAEKVAKTLNLDYCGVDLLIGENFEPILCEVNSNAFFEETERVCNVNVAKSYAEHIVKSLK